MTMALARAVPPRDAIHPIGTEEFARLMDRFGPFEPAPHVALAVSGGSDSMGLALLTAAWARQCGGRVTALTVDHGLRREAAAEAAQTGDWCRAYGMDHEILRWDGPHPASGIQEEARRARYRLLEAWCREQGVLHLFLAHQAEDQAETLLMRLLRSSGVDGLAGMSAIVELGAVRLLRPLLTVSRARLRVTLSAAGQRWIEDPSNNNPAYRRTALRAQLQEGEEAEAVVDRLGSLAPRFARLRQRREAEEAQLLACAVTLHPAGFALLDLAPFFAGSPELQLKVLAAILTTVGGGDYPPRGERLERLISHLCDRPKAGATLGGCLIRPYRGKLLICREPAAVAPAVEVVPGQTRWDGRFTLNLDGAAASLTFGALGADLATIRNKIPSSALASIPAAARPTLPALKDGKGLVAVPFLRYFNGRLNEAGTTPHFRMEFRPTRPLASAGFRIV